MGTKKRDASIPSSIEESQSVAGLILLLSNHTLQPFAEKGFDFGNETTDVPVQIQKKQAICYSNDSDVEDIACFIVSELKNSKDLDAKWCRRFFMTPLKMILILS